MCIIDYIIYCYDRTMNKMSDIEKDCGYVWLAEVLSKMETYHVESDSTSVSEKQALQLHIDFIVNAWNKKTYIKNYKLPDGREVSISNNAVGSKKPSIIIKTPIIENHHSPTSEKSVRNLLQTTKRYIR